MRDPATVEDLCRWADNYQNQYFGGKADIKIAVIEDPGGTACFDIASRTAYIDKAVLKSEKFSRIALLHEMVHINLFLANEDRDANHGSRFKQEIKRLMQSGAYDNLL